MRVPPSFEPVITDAIAAVNDLQRDGTAAPDTKLLLYGSVSTGMAQPGRSDVDLLAIGIEPSDAELIARALSRTHRTLCRDVTVGVAGRRDHEKSGDEAYGNRVFLRHYCVPLVGESPVPAVDFLGDERAARGFNGDIDRALSRWRQARRAELSLLARQVGRKTLFATAGLVSVAESGWTTDRGTAAERWRNHRPDLASDLDKLLGWSEDVPALPQDVANALAEDGIVSQIATDFADRIGLWDAT